MEQIKNQSNLVGEIRYNLNAQDYENSAKSFEYNIRHRNKDNDSGGVILVFISLMLLMLLMIILGSMDAKSTGVCVGIMVLSALTALLIAANDASKKKKASTGTLEKPEVCVVCDSLCKMLFYEDRLEYLSETRSIKIEFDDITKVYELADGIYIVWKKYKNNFFYIPARFFDNHCATQTVSFFCHKLGKRFVRLGFMESSKTPEYAQEPPIFWEEDDAPKYEFSFLADKKMHIKLSGKPKSKRYMFLIVVIGLLITAVTAASIYFNPSNAVAGFALGLLSVIGVLAVILWMIVLVNVLKRTKITKRNISIKFFDNKLIIKSPTETLKISYTAVKSVFLKNDNIVMVFDNNTYTNVPKSAAQSNEQFEELNQFISQFAKEKENNIA